MKNLISKNEVVWAVVAGVLFATSYPPFPAWALFFSFAPLWLLWYRTSHWKSVFILGFITQFVFTLIGFNWIAHTAVEYGHIPTVFSVLILIGFCCFASLNVVAAGLVAFALRKKFQLKALPFFCLVAVLSAAAEWFYPMIFPWNMGYPLLYSHFHSSQLAEIIGFNGLSVLVNLANALFAGSLYQYPKSNWSRPLIVFLIGLGLAEFSGAWVENRLPPEDKNLNVLLVQPNIGNYDKFFAERGYGYQEPVVQKDFEITLRGLAQSPGRPDLVIWPETAFPANLDSYYLRDVYPQRLLSLARERQVNMIVGAYSEDSPVSPGRRNYNAVFAITKDGTVVGSYRKNLLLAFGEYFPGAQYLPFLKKVVPEISDFGRGRGPEVFHVAGASLSPLICYEGLDTLFVQKTVALNPQILVNVTNDSWFGQKFEPWQHLFMTIARTVEYRRPMVRATNTGFSVIADMKGKILLRGPQDVEWTRTAAVPFLSTPIQTFFSKIAPYVSIIFLVLVAVTLMIGVTRSRSDVPRT